MVECYFLDISCKHWLTLLLLPWASILTEHQSERNWTCLEEARICNYSSGPTLHSKLTLLESGALLDVSWGLFQPEWSVQCSSGPLFLKLSIVRFLGAHSIRHSCRWGSMVKLLQQCLGLKTHLFWFFNPQLVYSNSIHSFCFC